MHDPIIKRGTMVALGFFAWGLVVPVLAAEPAGPRADVVVAAAGGGQFQTVQAALDSLPVDNRKRTVILIRSGDYPDKVLVNRSFVTLRGEDRKKTRLMAKVAPGPKLDASVVVDNASDVTFENLTMLNPLVDRGYVVAFASHTNATRLAFSGCDMSSGGGDAISPWSRGQYYFTNCWLSGTFHFFGPRGNCYVTDCQFWCLGSKISLFNEGISAPTDKLVIRNSTFDGPTAFGLGSYFRDAAFYFIDCKFSAKLLANGQLFRNLKNKSSQDYQMQWGEHRHFFAGCVGPDYPWLKDNIADSPAKTKATVTAQWALLDWNPEKTNP